MAAQTAEFVMRCFHARTSAHVLHLATRSYAEHKALNDFYDGIIDLADAFAETYQGKYGLLEGMTLPYTPVSAPKVMLAGFNDWISKNRPAVCERTDSALQNIIDEIVALTAQTLYKLRFLS